MSNVRLDSLPSVHASAGYALVLGVLVPTAVAWVVHRGHRWTRPADGPILRMVDAVDERRRLAHEWVVMHAGWLTPAFSRTPRAWDFAAPARGARFVRIETASGKFFGGWFAANSFVSTYPEPVGIFVEEQWNVDTDGSFVDRVPGSDGF
jgi:hypothetical protein